MLGSSDVNVIGMIELKRFSRLAAINHKATLRKLAQFWAYAYRTRRVIPVPALMRRLQDMVQSRDQADLAYRRLIAKFPKAKNLLRQYASFLNDVKHDRSAANAFFRCNGRRRSRCSGADCIALARADARMKLRRRSRSSTLPHFEVAAGWRMVPRPRRRATPRCR